LAPDLSDLLRKILEGKEIQTRSINDFLSKNKKPEKVQQQFQVTLGSFGGQ